MFVLPTNVGHDLANTGAETLRSEQWQASVPPVPIGRSGGRLCPLVPGTFRRNRGEELLGRRSAKSNPQCVAAALCGRCLSSKAATEGCTYAEMRCVISS